MKVVIINGFPESGKSLFTKFCCEKAFYGGDFSSVDYVKEVAAYAGWDGAKTPENRKFLAQLKVLLTEWGDRPFQATINDVEEFFAGGRTFDFEEDEMVAFIHCREPKEIDRFKQHFGEDAITLFIDRFVCRNREQSNESDKNVTNYRYDYLIPNNRSISELEESAGRFLDALGIRRKK